MESHQEYEEDEDEDEDEDEFGGEGEYYFDEEDYSWAERAAEEAEFLFADQPWNNPWLH